MSVEFKRILYPTDFSDVALCALGHAVGLANMFGSQLYCIHVLEDAYQYWSALGPESIPCGPPPEEMLETARKRMDLFRQEHFGELKSELITDVVMGRSFAEIIVYAKEKDIDLIVMATHGRGAVAQMLLGSTVEKVVRKAPCAVLTVRADGHEFSTS